MSPIRQARHKSLNTLSSDILPLKQDVDLSSGSRFTTISRSILSVDSHTSQHDAKNKLPGIREGLSASKFLAIQVEVAQTANPSSNPTEYLKNQL